MPAPINKFCQGIQDGNLGFPDQPYSPETQKVMAQVLQKTAVAIDIVLLKQAATAAVNRWIH